MLIRVFSAIRGALWVICVCSTELYKQITDYYSLSIISAGTPPHGFHPGVAPGCCY